MKILAIVAIVLGLIVFAASGAVLFMIYSPGVQVSPTMVLGAAIWGLLVLAIALVCLSVAAIRRP